MSDRSLFDEVPYNGTETAMPRQQTAGDGTDRALRVGRIRLSALWAAYGDALGFISELTDAKGLRRRTGGRELTMPLEWQRRVGGRGGVNATLPMGCYSDDTQLRIAVARAIGPTGFDVEAFAKVELPVWLAYALGGGLSTKAAATNLAKTTTAWFSNTYRGWLDSGGNGAAMRIQPHVWAAPNLNEPNTYLLDVLRNSVCTHAHPTALVGATIHALALAQSMETGTIPSPAILSKLVDDAGTVPSMLRDDPQLGELWLTGWEREARRPFGDAWQAARNEIREAISTAEHAVTSSPPTERYGSVIDALNLLDPDRRGSGTITVVAAAALTWCDERPAESLATAANTIGSDTDTIATMAGALLGATAADEPPVPVMDSALIASEAGRMADLAGGGGTIGHRYPDLLTWTAPKTQADALLSADDGLQVAGLGRVRRTLGEPIPARQGPFQWQWAELEFGQTILIKRRENLPVDQDREQMGGDTDKRRPHRREVLEMLAAHDTVQSERSGWREDRPDRGRGSTQERAASGPDQRNRPLDLERVIEWVRSEQDNNASIGYAIRRVANEASPEQTAAFLAVLLEMLRRPPRDR
ncbi:MAG: ADP-ribosylglycohydrolase family protein [Acidimicrobiia bacterium]|nr:ADP-ribosylglycohydrolase family protein [Acidimicrobiia bacterium]